LNKDLFRKVSLERLSSPEQLDQLMGVTSFKGWLALLALGLIIVSGVLWGFYGEIPEKVSGLGILVKTGGVIEVSHFVSGRIIDISVAAGDTVECGAVVARVDQPEIKSQIKDLNIRLTELNKKRVDILNYNTGSYKLKKESFTEQRANIDGSIRTGEDRLSVLEQRIADQQKLFKDGLVTKQVIFDKKNEYNSVKEQILESRNQLKQIDIQEMELKRQADTELKQIDVEIGENRNAYDKLQKNYSLYSKIICPFSGRVIEVRNITGDLYAQGNALISVELSGKNIKDLEAVIYVSPADGKKITGGMEIQISPSTVKKEEFGSMIGVVTSVSQYPSSFQEMHKTLGNDQLVQTLSGSGSPIEIKADLVPDFNTMSGFRWTSPKGPPVRIFSGTLCGASVVTERKRPISYVIPLLKEYTGL